MNSQLRNESKRNHPLRVQTLLLFGANVNSADVYSRTALMLAAENGHHDVAIILIKAGAKINKKDCHGRTSLYLAAIKNDLGMAFILVNAGADVNAQDSKRISPLMIASALNRLNLCLLLVQHGSDIDLEDSNGDTAMHIYGRILDEPSESDALSGSPWNQPLNFFLGDDGDQHDLFNHNNNVLWYFRERPLPPNMKTSQVSKIRAYRAKYLAVHLKIKRQAAWDRRKNLLSVVTSHGFRPLAARVALHPEVNPSASISPIPRGTPEQNQAYLLGQVLTNEAFFKTIVSYL